MTSTHSITTYLSTLELLDPILHCENVRLHIQNTLGVLDPEEFGVMQTCTAQLLLVEVSALMHEVKAALLRLRYPPPSISTSNTTPAPLVRFTLAKLHFTSPFSPYVTPSILNESIDAVLIERSDVFVTFIVWNFTPASFSFPSLASIKGVPVKVTDVVPTKLMRERVTTDEAVMERREEEEEETFLIVVYPPLLFNSPPLISTPRLIVMDVFSDE